MKRFLLPFLLLLFVGVAESSAINTGYYRVKSYNDKYLTEIISNHTLVCSDLRDGNYTQVWYLTVNGSNVTFQNALTERYVEGSTNTYEQWLTDDNSHTFTLNEADNVYTFANSGNWGIHCDGSNNVVGWYTSDDKSKWTLEAVTVDNAALAAQQAALLETTTEQLTTFFTTTACTALKNPYSGYSDSELRSAMSALSTTVQDMAIKVKNNSWTTYDGWDKTEKTFRIADYKAYSSHSRWTSILGYGHLMGRLSNPTGIWVNTDDIIQVYVGDIPDGQAVKLEVAGHGQASGTTYDLHEGMNCLLMASSGNCFVFYEVDNTNSGKTPYTALSDYADVTVHIEGGTVQGYFDLTKGDDDADWTQLTTHLLSKDNVCLKSSKHVMNLKKSWLTTALNGSSVVNMLNVWKNLSEGQDELTGRSDAYGGETIYGQYCNNLSSVTSLGGDGASGNPHATNYGTFYYNDYHQRIFNATNLLTVADNMWCIAHEQGHNRQTPINMVGNTEISNNLFSNVAIYKQGRYTSRTASIQAVFDDYLAGVSWPERVARSCNNVDGYNQQMLHFNWSLYMFFHLNGNDPDFFPRLYDALRADPMTRKDVSVSEGTVTGGQFTAASDDYLKYYVKCCEVSGYDLTDFFTSYGFFIIPNSASLTLGNITTTQYQFINDYSKSCLYVTQEMIDAAKATVSALNLPKANITFIEDRVKAPLATYEGHAEGELRTINPDAPVKSFGAVGEMGQYTDFGAPCSAYTFNISSRGNVTVSGTGAVGIIVYDNSGNIVGFYNTKTFRLPASAFDENGLKSGYSIKAAAGNGTMAAATYDSSVEVNEFPKTGVWYVLVTPLREGRFTQSNGVGQGMTGTTVTTPTAAMQWQFVERDGEPETFDIINRADNSYISPVPGDGSQLSTSSTQPSSGWKVGDAQTEGYHIIYSGETQLHQGGSGDNYKTLSYGYWYGSYNTTDGGCQFAIEEVNELASTVLDELAGLDISVSGNAADDLTTGQWYVMYDRGLTQGKRHGYLYENATSHTLYNTLTVPSGSATDACKYLVRLIDAGDGKYYIQTGYGNYFWTFKGSTNVAASAYRLEKITIDKINGTAGHFYLQASNNVILDANECETAGDATVVGYGTTVPSSTGGNNDWAFYPVTFTCPVKLNAYGYATFAGNYAADYTDDSSFSAWTVKSVSGEEIVFQQIKEVAAPGTGVLLMGQPSTSVSVPLTNQNDGTDFSNENLLVGITSPTLIASDAYYGLSGNNFVKVNAGTVPARKALLQASVVDGAHVKALTFVFNSEDGIETMSNGQWTMDNVQIYNLAGQRLSKPQRGINIINGKKVLVK